MQIAIHSSIKRIAYGLKEKRRQPATPASDVKLAREDAFQLLGGEAQVELSAYGYGYAPGLL